VTIEFFDKDDESLAAWTTTLHTGQLYRASDEPNTLIACLAPDSTAMFGSAELPDSVVVDELDYAVYRFSYFAGDILPFDLVPTDALTVTGVELVTTASNHRFRGGFENGLDVAVRDPSVTVFPLTSVGRPIDMATSIEPVDIAPNTSWMFETTPVNDPGVDRAVFPAASL
jgi:hypothetical protein